jgi:hypothetical protein
MKLKAWGTISRQRWMVFCQGSSHGIARGGSSPKCGELERAFNSFRKMYWKRIARIVI